MINIVVCFYKPAETELIRNVLCRAGYRVAYSCCSGAKALEACLKLGSGVIVSGYRMLDMICLDLFDSKPDSFEMITVANPKNWQYVLPPDGMLTTDIPLNTNELLEFVDEADHKLKKAKIEKRSRHTIIRSDEDSKVLLTAKEKCISEMKMDEPQAHKYIQNLAMNNGVSLVEAAKLVLAG